MSRRSNGLAVFIVVGYYCLSSSRGFLIRETIKTPTNHHHHHVADNAAPTIVLWCQQQPSMQQENNNAEDHDDAGTGTGLFIDEGRTSRASAPPRVRGVMHHQMTRRNTLISSAALAAATTTAASSSLLCLPVVVAACATGTSIEPVAAKEGTATTTTINNNNLDCLLDLPPLDRDTHVRLYFCRHGETDHNRFGRTTTDTGSSSNNNNEEPINERGRQQAVRLGQALARLPHPPTTVFHSKLTRAWETAEIASRTMMTTTTSGAARTIIRPRELSTLARIDFGASVVVPSSSARWFRSQMIATYFTWTQGNNVDRRIGKGGESGREVMARIEQTFQSMVAEAKCSTSGSCAAVSHSTFLRMMLLAVTSQQQQEQKQQALASSSLSLFHVATMQQANCCINVLDVSREIGNTMLPLPPHHHNGAAAPRAARTAVNDNHPAAAADAKMIGVMNRPSVTPTTTNNKAITEVSSSRENYGANGGADKLYTIVRINEKRHLTGLV